MLTSAISFTFALVSAACAVGFDTFMERFKKGVKREGQEINPPESFTQAELGTHYLVLTQGPHPAFLSEEARYKHVQATGVPGTGKTQFVLKTCIRQDIRSRAGALVVDVKSNLDKSLLNYARECGRGHDFLRFQVQDPDHSLTYNPCVGDNPTEVANRVWNAFFGDDKTLTDYYREMAKSFCRNFFEQCHALGVQATLAQLQQTLLSQEHLEALILMDPSTDSAQFLKRRYLGISHADFTKNFEGFVNKLTPLTSGPFGRLLNIHAPQMLMSDIIAKRRIACFGLAADIYPADFKILSTMILMDLQSNLTDRYDRNCPGFFVYLDEFADLVYPEFRPLLAKARAANVGLTLAHQEISDLEAVSPAFAKMVMGLAANKIVLRVGTSETAEQFARLFGTKAVTRPVVNYALQGDGLLAGGKQAKGLTEVTEEQFIVHPNHLKNQAMGMASMILQRRHGRVLRQGKLLPAPRLNPHFYGPYHPTAEPPRTFKPLVFGALPDAPIPLVTDVHRTPPRQPGSKPPWNPKQKPGSPEA